MDIGFAVPVAGSWATATTIVDLSRRAEALGYASLWTFQRLLVPVGPDDAPVLPPQYRSVLDPLTVLAHVAAVTNTARLGVAVVNMPYEAPVVLAKSLTTIDHLSSGRLDVGLGIGWMQQEFDAAGADMARRGARAEDYLACLRTIWADEVVEYHGEFYEVPRSRIDPKPVQRPHPPLLLGGGAPAALRRIGRLADGWVSSSAADLSRIDEPIGIVQEAAHNAGRDAGALRFVVRGVVKVRADERGPLTGSLDDIAADIAALADKGVTEVFVDLNFDPEIGSPDADPVRSVEQAHEVLEALAPGA